MGKRNQGMHFEVNREQKVPFANDDNGIWNLDICNTTYRIVDISKIGESSLKDENNPKQRTLANNAGELGSQINIEYEIPKEEATVQEGKVSDDGDIQNESHGETEKDTIQIATKCNRKPKRSNICDVCGKFYKNVSYLLEHRKRHAETKSLKCDLCGKGFNMEKDLKNHIKSHLKERPFSCGICSKSFTRASLLNYHMRIHTGERPYVCDICQLTFTRPFCLAQHKQRMHMSDKGKHFKCDEETCSKVFVTRSERKTHINLVHNREKSFRCTLCEKVFGIKALVTNHMNQHHSTEEPYICPSSGCDKKFKTIYNVIAHVRSHHKDFKYKCPHCPLEFKSKSQFNRHLKSVNEHVKFKHTKDSFRFHSNLD